MPNRSYGNILRIERERSGYDLTSMSRRLHIRPDILQAIENSDFDRMPARGYSKNMVRAYARALKLNEQDITNMFLDEMHEYEVGAPRRPSGQRGSYGAGQSGARRQDARSYESSDRRANGSQREGRGRSSRTGRELVSSESANRSRSTRQDASSSRSQQRSRSSQAQRQDPGIGERMMGGLGSVVGSITQGRSRQDGRVPKNFSTIGSTPPYARNSSTGTQGGLAGMNLPMVLAIVAAIIVLLIVVVVISNGSKQAQEDVPDIPISGLTDTSSPEDSPEATSLDSAPEFAEFSYAVEDGGESWIEIYEDGSDVASFADVVTGPAEETFEVRDKLTIQTGNPSVVTLTLDGEEVEFEKKANSAVYYYTVDFEEILDQWNIDHGRASSKSSKSSSSSDSSSSGSNSSSSSSSSKSSSSKASSSSSSSKSSTTR